MELSTDSNHSQGPMYLGARITLEALGDPALVLGTFCGLPLSGRPRKTVKSSLWPGRKHKPMIDFVSREAGSKLSGGPILY